MNTINAPSFTAEASLYYASQHYGYAVVRAGGTYDSVLAQSLFCSRLEQPCGGDLNCCPGLKCTARPGGLSVCVSDSFRCSPCIGGRQFCCPPPGVGLRCFVRKCKVRL